MTKKVAFSQTALVAAIVMASPVQAASDYRKLYRGNDGPGMAATADIRTGRRSIMSYLMSPIDEARLEAGRER